MRHLCNSFVFALFALAGCSGGGGADSATDDPVTRGTGTLTILVGDNANDFDRMLIMVEEVRLLMEDGQQQFVLETPQQIDLLALENVTEVFLSEEIVAGTIAKIRLLVSEILLQRVDADGMVIEEFEADLPPKIDLNPRGGIDVGVGDHVMVELDVDAKRSVHIVGTGNGRHKFRPVVFVKVIAATDTSRLLRLFGNVVENGAGGWELCALERLSEDDGGDNLAVSDCIPLDVDDAMIAALADTGEVEDGVLEANAPATVFGFVGFDGDVRLLDTVLVALGERGAYDTIHDIVIADDMPASVILANNVTVALPGGDKIFDSAGIANALIPVGSKVEAFGIMTDVDAFQALLASVNDPDPETIVSGAIAGAPVAGGFTLDDVDATEVCVDAMTTYFDLTTVGDTTTSAEIAFSDLMDMDAVDAYGAMGDTCFAANVIVRINE